MSDQKPDQPVENVENTDVTDEQPRVEDVVGSANEGLAEAELAARDAVDDAPTVTSPAAESDAATVAYETPAHHDLSYIEQAPITPSEPAATVVAPEVVAPVVPVAPVAPVAPQPIFVQAPEAPRPRGNRAAAGLIGLLAAVAFGILYLAAALGIGAISGDVTGASVGERALSALQSWWFWVPVLVFYLAFWLLGAIINRGRWGAWVNVGLLVGVAAYGGHLLGQLFQAPFWSLTASEGAALVEGQVLAPLAIAAFVIGRELTIWFGAWVAARGRRVTELNTEALREYERTLEAGPRLHQG